MSCSFNSGFRKTRVFRNRQLFPVKYLVPSLQIASSHIESFAAVKQNQFLILRQLRVEVASLILMTSYINTMAGFFVDQVIIF